MLELHRHDPVSSDLDLIHSADLNSDLDQKNFSSRIEIPGKVVQVHAGTAAAESADAAAEWGEAAE